MKCEQNVLPLLSFNLSEQKRFSVKENKIRSGKSRNILNCAKINLLQPKQIREKLYFRVFKMKEKKESFASLVDDIMVPFYT